MVTTCQPKPISINFDSPRRGRGMHLCVEDMVQNWIGQKKMTILVTISYLFCCNKDLIRAILPIYYGTSSLTFCQISGLKEAFEKIIKYQTALKFEFRSMHLIGQKIFTILRMLIFSATEICAELCCQSTWGHFPQLSAKFEP